MLLHTVSIDECSHFVWKVQTAAAAVGYSSLVIGRIRLGEQGVGGVDLRSKCTYVIYTAYRFDSRAIRSITLMSAYGLLKV